MRLRWDAWFYGLGQATIGGAAASGSAYVAMLIGNQVTPTIPIMNWQTLGFVLLTSSVTNLFFYLKQSPLPQAIEDSDPAAFRKTVENAVEKEKEKEKE